MDSDICTAAARYTGDSHICTAARYTGDSHICTAARYTGDSHICTAAIYDPQTGRKNGGAKHVRDGHYTVWSPTRLASPGTAASENNPWSGGGAFSAKESRDALKTYFETGDIPTQDQFASAKVPRNVLKEYFQTGDKPTAAQFAALIDSMVHRNDDRYLLGLRSYSVQIEKFNFKQEFGPTQAQKKD